LVFGYELPEAVALGRYHHQWLPDTLVLEKGCFQDSLFQALEARGHTIGWRETVGPDGIGVVNAIERNPATGELVGVGDGRREAVARGVEANAESTP
ncbi:MAG: gamma-glutamyltransferase, partial [Acidobacteria bacterium]|nr:gamma-glutamyltransferase [Acidobacteriota bacterium]